MQHTPETAVDTEPIDEAPEAEHADHPGADTLNVPTFDDAGFLRWGHTEPEEENEDAA
jgi:hypothetical protein